MDFSKSLKLVGLAVALVLLTLASGKVGEIAASLEGQENSVNVSPLYRAGSNPTLAVPDIEPFVGTLYAWPLFPGTDESVLAQVSVCFHTFEGYPVVPLRMRKAGSSGTWWNAVALFDTGADFTVFPKAFADLLGIDLTSGRRWEACGVGGACIVLYEHEVEVDIREPTELPEGVDPTMVKIEPFTISVYFTERDDALGGPPLLGREGFLTIREVSIRYGRDGTGVVCVVTWQRLPFIVW
jgi:hypothetical protein